MLYVNQYVCDKQQEPCKICTMILRVIFIKLSVYYTCQVNMVLNQSAGRLQSVHHCVSQSVSWSVSQSIAPLFHQSVYGSISGSVSQSAVTFTVQNCISLSVCQSFGPSVPSVNEPSSVIFVSLSLYSQNIYQADKSLIHPWPLLSHWVSQQADSPV